MGLLFEKMSVKLDDRILPTVLRFRIRQKLLSISCIEIYKQLSYNEISN